MRQKVQPVVQQRFGARGKGDANPDHVFGDRLEGTMDFARDQQPENDNMKAITDRMIFMSLGLMHQLLVTRVSTILNIVFSDAEHNSMENFRDEFHAMMDRNCRH
jgi:hypothetical protein